METNKDMPKCVILKEWVDAGLEDLDREEMQEYCYGLLMYALYGEIIETDNKAIRMSLKAIYPNMDRIRTEYEKKIAGGESNTGKFKYDPLEVYQLAQQYKTAPRVIAALNQMHPEMEIKSSGLYSNKGWQDRKLTLEEFCNKNKVDLPIDVTKVDKEEEKPSISAPFVF